MISMEKFVRYPKHASSIIIAYRVLIDIAKMFNPPVPDDVDKLDAHNDNKNVKEKQSFIQMVELSETTLFCSFYVSRCVIPKKHLNI